MRSLLAFARGIDRLNDGLFAAIRWLTLVMILVGAANALLRYATKFTGVPLASNAWLDAQWYMFSLIFLLGAAAGLRQEMHVRVDVLYERLTERGKAWIDLVGTLLFLLPFCAMMLVVSWPAIANSWSVREGPADPGGLARWPIKTVILACFVLLFLQGIAQVIHKVALLRGKAAMDPTGAPPVPVHHVEAV
jgi:TRAP-type mannitol/chloroaromatic compound transport system permease small subunit